MISEAASRAFDFIRGRKRAYQLCFGNAAGHAVIADLMKFCRATESTFDADPRIHAVLEGRREVFLRIQNHLNLTSEDLYKLAAGKPLNSKGD